MTAALRVEGLHAGYGSSVVLRDVSFSVETGEVACLMGRNGAGKTTLLKALMSVLPKTGKVFLGGEDVTDVRTSRLNHLGMFWVPQEEAVFPGFTVREHLRLAFGEAGYRAGLDKAASLFPVLGERLEQEAQTLSGGERKMLGIGMAYALAPTVVLMDEPTEGVAPVTVEKLLPAIRTLSETSAVLLVEQNVDTAVALGSRGYVLEHGDIVESGDVAEMHAQGVLERRLSL